MTTANVTLVLIGLSTAASILGYDRLEKHRHTGGDLRGRWAEWLKMVAFWAPGQWVQKSQSVATTEMGSSNQ